MKFSLIQPIIQRIFSVRLYGVQLVICSLFANLLALASPLFVMQVLNRYLSYGVDATLQALFLGVIIAIVLELMFRQIRLQLASMVSQEPDQKVAEKTYKTLIRAMVLPLQSIKPGMRSEVLQGPEIVAQAYGVNGINVVLDLPFAFLFLLAIAAIQLKLAVIALLFFAVAILVGSLMSKKHEAMGQQRILVKSEQNAMLAVASDDLETVRVFNGQMFLLQQLKGKNAQLLEIQSKLDQGKIKSQNVSQSLSSVMSAVLIGVAAVLTLAGEMNVGAMIGVNILASRAFMSIMRYNQLLELLTKASHVTNFLDRFHKIPQECQKGLSIRNYSGRLDFKDLAFMYPGASKPLFEGLNLTLEAGQIAVVTGQSNSGKTTLAKLLVGIYEPIRGQILVDGVDLRQLNLVNWRRKILYFPQEPVYLNASFRDNILLNNPSLSEEQLVKIIDRAGLKTFFDESQSGLEGMIRVSGRELSFSVRKKLSLVRGLSGLQTARLAVLDEPVEGLDEVGFQCVYSIINELKKEGKTIIVFSRNSKIIENAHKVIDLNRLHY